MGTTADKLELLLRTKERQKAYLQEKYPLLDFDTIPFRAYLDLFQGRSYVPGFVGGWKAYGKRNDDADRDVLYDYSGNGRDIELFNFAFAGMSGYGGYGTDSWTAYGSNSEQINSTTVKLTAAGEFNGVKLGTINRGDANITIRYRVAGVLPTYGLELCTNTLNDEGYIIPKIIREINADGEYEDSISFDGDTAGSGINYSSIFLVCRTSSIIEGTNLLIEQLPFYPGALVSDGIDDYGQCIKGFALPGDYTVAAVRKTLKGNNGGLACKGGAVNGAFLFDAGDVSVVPAWSFGSPTSVPTSKRPALFSYQSKASYNGVELYVGDNVDSESNKLTLFTQSSTTSDRQSVALYDLRIYDHSLTAEELQTVKDEMLSDYENATGGGIADITYVADWDGKGRSNDEEADVRSKWIDKATGKVINLSNYAYSQMSGWNGYSFPSFKVTMEHSDRYVGTISNSVAHITDIIGKDSNNIVPLEWYKKNIENSPANQAFRISGIPDDIYIEFDYVENGSTGISTVLFSTKNGGDGIYEAKNVPPADFYRFRFYKKDNSNFTGHTNCNIFIEMLPLYPGALVSDGVDDRGLGAEPITEEIKTVVMHLVGLAPVWAFFIEGADGDQTKRIGASYSNGKLSVPGIGNIENDGKAYGFNRNVPAPNNRLNIGCAEWLTNPTEYGKSAIRRLIFIKEQLDAAQQEFLEWKVEKEYRDWCKENGYDYAIDEMMNN